MATTASTLTMPSGFVLPVYKITRILDGLSTWSTRQGGVVEIARFYGEEKKSFHAQLKTGWGRHVDKHAASFVFASRALHPLFALLAVFAVLALLVCFAW